MTIVHSEGIIRCEKYGIQEDILIDSDKPSYKDPPREMSCYSYKKLNHLSECKVYINNLLVLSLKYILGNLKLKISIKYKLIYKLNNLLLTM